MAASMTFLLVIKIIIRMYDILTGWMYALFTRPGATVKAHSRVRAVPTKAIREDDTQVTYKPVDMKTYPLVQDFNDAKIGTMAETWSWAVKRYGGRKLLGTRDILGEDDEIQSNGRIFSKLELGDYRYVGILQNYTPELIIVGG